MALMRILLTLIDFRYWIKEWFVLTKQKLLSWDHLDS
jgi:hypothetical protein